MRIKPILNKWQFGFYIGKDYNTLGWRFMVRLIKILELPERGALLAPNQYKGFIFELLPRVTRQRIFIVPIWFKRLCACFKIRTYDAYVVPTRWKF